MNESQIIFLDGINLHNEDLFWDVIEKFQDSLSNGLEEKFVDDCFLNIAICYMKLNLFNEAKEYFQKAIEATATSGDKVDVEGSIVGKTSDRANLGLIRISLAHNDIQSAEKLLEYLDNTESYVEINNENVSMHQLALNEINSIKKKTD
mgnify:FL=1